jgi:hypothetical protein
MENRLHNRKMCDSIIRQRGVGSNSQAEHVAALSSPFAYHLRKDWLRA